MESPLLPSSQPPRRRVAVAAGVTVALVACAGAAMLLTPSNKLKATATPVSLAADPVCGTAVSPGSLPFVHILGAPSLPPFREFAARVCTPLYEGPNCANVTSFNGEVTLCVDGTAIHGVSMRSRGHVSMMFPKQQFLLTLPEEMGLLGMAPATQFTLATSYVDTSFQRNPAAFELYRSLGGWAPASRFVTMAWEGVDFGLYYIGEPVEVGPGRLELQKAQDPADSGYLLVADWPKNQYKSFTTSATATSFNMQYPKLPSDEQSVYVQTFLDELDRRAAGTSVGALEDMLDFASAARYYVLMELVKDADGYAFSDYWELSGGRLRHAAPWDFDLAFGFDCANFSSVSALTGEVFGRLEGWNVELARDSMPWIGPTGLPNDSIQWFGLNKRQLFLNIWGVPSFRAAFVEAWREARATNAGPLADDALRAMVAQMTGQIDVAARHDIDIWRHSRREGFFSPCHPDGVANFDNSVRHLTNFMLERAQWVDEHVETLL